MRKEALLIALLIGLAFAQTEEEMPTDAGEPYIANVNEAETAEVLGELGCSPSGSGWLCPNEANAVGVEAVVKGEIICFPNASCKGAACIDYVDECLGVLAFEKDTDFEFCSTFVNKTDIEQDAVCTNQTFKKNVNLPALINPYMVDLDSCKLSYNESLQIYGLECPYDGKKVVFNGIATGGGFFITEMAEITGAAPTAIFTQNWVYILLGIVLAAVLYWAFRTRK